MVVNWTNRDFLDLHYNTLFWIGFLGYKLFLLVFFKLGIFEISSYIGKHLHNRLIP